MGAYLVDNAPRRRQFRNPRRERPSGVFVLHSAENVPDLRPPDTGAENVARFIKDRADAGSYHEMCDADSHVSLVPWSFEAFHDATGTNPHSIGISAAWQAHQLPRLLRDEKEWTGRVVVRMAERAAAAASWLRSTYGIIVPARRITVAEARARRPGFVTHAELDPRRRSDPGAAFPWDLFLAAFRDFTKSGGSATPTEDEQMAITLDQIGLKVIEAVRWCVSKDDTTREAIRALVPSLDQIGLKAIEAVRWCVTKDDVCRKDLKALVREVLDERDAA